MELWLHATSLLLLLVTGHSVTRYKTTSSRLWLVAIANLMVVIHVIGSYQVLLSVHPAATS
jgi:hypothetical protein